MLFYYKFQNLSMVDFYADHFLSEPAYMSAVFFMLTAQPAA